MRLFRNSDEQGVDGLKKIVFFEGLPKKFEIMFAMNGIDDVNSAITNFTKAEQLIISANVQEVENKPRKENFKPKLSINPNKDSKKTDAPWKFCTVHEVNSHGDEDCYLQKRQKSEKSAQERGSNGSSKTNGKKLNNNGKSLNLVEQTGMINDNFTVSILLDTGSEKSYISSKIVKTNNLETTELDSFKVKLANKDSIEIVSKCNIRINIPGILARQIDELYVISDLNYDIILGTDFMDNCGLLFDFKNEFVKIGHNILTKQDVFHVKGNEKTSNAPELSLDKLIEDYKSNTEIGGSIKNVVFEIPLKEHRIISKRAYTVPLHARQQLKSHWDQIFEKNIIRYSDSLYASPSFTIPNPDNDIRLLIDFRNFMKFR